MVQYAALDVLDKDTAIHVLDEHGRLVWKGKRASEPEVLATALQCNKTDARDAETLAQLVRTGWYREARVKGWAAHAVRPLVNARSQLVGISTDLSNQRSGACSRPLGCPPSGLMRALSTC